MKKLKTLTLFLLLFILPNLAFSSAGLKNACTRGGNQLFKTINGLTLFVDEITHLTMEGEFTIVSATLINNKGHVVNELKIKKSVMAKNLIIDLGEKYKKADVLEMVVARSRLGDGKKYYQMYSGIDTIFRFSLDAGKYKTISVKINNILEERITSFRFYEIPEKSKNFSDSKMVAIINLTSSNK